MCCLRVGYNTGMEEPITVERGPDGITVWIKAGTYDLRPPAPPRVFNYEGERLVKTPDGFWFNAGKPVKECPDCAVPVGSAHVSGCDIERCSVCGGQWIMCGHKEHDPAKSVWTGFFPGAIEAAEEGYFVLPRTEDRGWVECSADAPGARPDLNRLEEVRRGLRPG